MSRKIGVDQVGFDEEVPFYYEHPDYCRKCGSYIGHTAHWHDVEGDETSSVLCIDCYIEEMWEEENKEEEKDGR